MKNRLLTFIARCFLVYQLVKLVKTLTRIMRRYAEIKAGVSRQYGPPRPYYRR